MGYLNGDLKCRGKQCLSIVIMKKKMKKKEIRDMVVNSIISKGAVGGGNNLYNFITCVLWVSAFGIFICCAQSINTILNYK